MLSRSPGAEHLILPAVALFAALIAGPAMAQAEDPGAAAFAARDYERAWSVWRFNAWLGDPEAKAGLGMLNDLGLGTGRDPERAFAWYAEAGADGVRDAQLNAGIMADAGIGTDRDPAQAAYWYARAAAHGEPRAALNLGLLYASGTGVPENVALARYWLTRAAETLPGARDRLERLPEGQSGDLAAPAVTAVEAAKTGGGIDIVWTSRSMPPGARFRIEVTALADPPRRVSFDTEGSALALPTERVPEGPLGIRVIQVQPGAAHYAASPWYAVDAEAALRHRPPRGEVRLEHAEDDRRAARYARELASSLASSDLSASVASGGAAPPTSAVLYGYAEDAALAEDVAAFLSGSIRAEPAPAGAGLAPGEIVVRLVGGPAAAVQRTSRTAPDRRGPDRRQASAPRGLAP